MSNKLWTYIGLLIPTVLYAPLFRDLTALAPDIAAYSSLGESARTSLERDVAYVSSSIYNIHLVLLVCIGASRSPSRSASLQLTYFLIGVMSAICLMYMAMWTMLQQLIPGSYSWYDVAGFVLIAMCILVIRNDTKRVRRLTHAT